MKKALIIMSAVIAAGSIFTSCKKGSDVQSASEVMAPKVEEKAEFTPDFRPSEDGTFRDVHIWNSTGVQYDGYNFNDRVWMDSNLKAVKYADGTPISYFEEGNAGNLYSYYDAYENHKGLGDTQGACPNGYHLPNLDEWAWTAAMIKGEAKCDPNDGGCLSVALRANEWDGNNISGLAIQKEKGFGGNLGSGVTGFWFRDGALIIQYWGTEWKSVDEAGKMANLSVRCIKN